MAGWEVMTLMIFMTSDFFTFFFLEGYHDFSLSPFSVSVDGWIGAGMGGNEGQLGL